MKKRLLSIILSMAMCVTALPMTAFADVTEYDLWVNGEQFTSEKLTIQCGDGTAEFDPDMGKLTLTDATITKPNVIPDTAAFGICCEMKDSLVVNVYGNNTIDLSKADIDDGIENVCGIYYDCGYDIILLDGSGSLNIDLGADRTNYTYPIYSKCALSIEGISLDCKTADYGIYAVDYLYMCPRTFKVATRIKSFLFDTDYLECDYDAYNVLVAANAAGTDAATWDGTTFLSDFDYQYVSMELTKFPVWVNGERFTSDNKEIKCGDGTAKFDPEKNELRLKDVTITEIYSGSFSVGAIYAEHGIDIVTEGNNVINLDDSIWSYGIFVYGNLSLSGEGSLDVNVADSDSCGICAANGNLSVDMSGKLTINAGDDGLYTYYDLKITGSGDIDITADDVGINAYRDITISGSGDVNVTSVGDTFATFGNLILSGTGKVIGTSEEANCVTLYDADGAVLLNGKNPEVSFTTASASDDNYAVSECKYDYAKGGYIYSVGTVAGNNLAKYDVEGAPKESSVKYTLRTYNVTFDMGEHGTAPEDQTVAWDETIEKPSDPTADGYKFEGWYSDRACTKAFDFEVAYNVDMTVFAKWTCLHKNTEVRDAKDASLTEKGYTGDTYCKDCGELIKKGEEIPMITPEPTPTNEPTPTPTNEPTPTPTVPPTTPTPAPELNVGDFVDRCYEVALGREADEEGYNYWKDQLTNGEACGAQAGFGFIFSAEYANKNTTNEQFVTDMYSMFFGREADEAGYNYWLEQLNAGTATREQVFAGFANSEEFYNLCNKYGVVSGAYVEGVANDQQGGVNCFVARLYKVCLNRLPDMGGQAGWVQKLLNGEVSGSSCAYGFVFSPEFINMNLGNSDFVNYMYKAFFGREADEEGLNYWVEQLNAGTATREDIFAGFSGSAEFANLCASYGISA